VDPGLADLAVRAAKAVGGGFLGVDLLERVDGGIAVNEVNAGTEFRGLAEATGVAVGDALVDHVLEKVRS
jgi:[lysine-biosynthesis-protein LysW]--L-2-aminoadipate ligase